MPTGTMEETDILFPSAKLSIKNEKKKEVLTVQLCSWNRANSREWLS